MVVVPLLWAVWPGGLRSEVRVDWTKYHNYEETTRILEEYHAEYESLTRLYSIGKSFQGKELWCLELTNYETGAPETKAGINIVGNTHAGEVSGAEVSLYIIDMLLTGYTSDPTITRLVDTKVFYIIPKMNPDGSDSYLRNPGEPVDPGLKKVDDDGDGEEDEDGPDDLNGDGIISLMRIRDEKGSLKTSSEEPRLMVERQIDEKGEWTIIGPEGLDNDEDGRINEDPPGRLNTMSNRNYPAFWAPEWIQRGAGVYPLSEPESKAQVDFVLAHPNIAVTQAYHTHSGIILWGHAALTPDHMPKEDRDNYRAIGELGEEMTGYPFVSVFHDFTPDKFNPRHGDFTDWVYEHFGAYGMVVEIWKAPGELGKSAMDGWDEHVAMEWNDKELGGSGFVDWQKYSHPQFGEIEIGGWKGNTLVQNPPARFMEAEWKKVARFELKRAEMAPHVVIGDVRTESLANDLVRLEVNVMNDGFLPTYVTRKAVDNGLAKPIRAELTLSGAELLAGESIEVVGHLKGTNPKVYSYGDSETTVKWVVRRQDENAKAEVTIVSQKAGTVSKEVTLHP
jgi:hypothetical protein